LWEGLGRIFGRPWLASLKVVGLLFNFPGFPGRGVRGPFIEPIPGELVYLGKTNQLEIPGLKTKEVHRKLGRAIGTKDLRGTQVIL